MRGFLDTFAAKGIYQDLFAPLEVVYKSLTGERQPICELLRADFATSRTPFLRLRRFTAIQGLYVQVASCEESTSFLLLMTRYL